MKIKFLGGAEEVGRLAIKMDFGGSSVMVDYGLIPEKPPEYPLPPEKVDGVFLTHSHLDHAGSLPVYFNKYDSSFYATLMTANSIRPMLEDTIKIANLEGYTKMFNHDDVSQLYSSFVPVNYGDADSIKDLDFQAFNAGHIPGSTMWKFTNGSEYLVTGDLYTRDTNLLSGAQPVKAENLIVESTYAGKNHEDRQKVIDRLRSRIREVVATGGKVILPTFAVGRTQELIMILADMGYNIYVDGMGNTITSIYLHTPGFFRSGSEFKKAVKKTVPIRNQRERLEAKNADIIITTSGMLDGGPVLSHIRGLLEDDKSAIFITGYQVEGTNGRSLLENGTLNIDGSSVRPKMKVEFFDLSAHAGHDDLIKFIDAVNPKRVVLCHGEMREKLLEDLANYEVILPYNGNVLEFS